MTTAALRYSQIHKDYRLVLIPEEVAPMKAARLWFNRRKFRRQARRVMDFVRVPQKITLRYKLR